MTAQTGDNKGSAVEKIAGVFASLVVNTVCLVPAALMVFGEEHGSQRLGSLGAWFVWMAVAYMAVRAIAVICMDIKKEIAEFSADDFIVALLTLSAALSTDRYILASCFIFTFPLLHLAIIHSNELNCHESR